MLHPVLEKTEHKCLSMCACSTSPHTKALWYVVLAALSNTSEQFRPLLFAKSRLETFTYLDDFGGVLNNVNYSYILFFVSQNSDLRISHVCGDELTSPKGPAGNSKGTTNHLRRTWKHPRCSPARCYIQPNHSNWLKELLCVIR